MLHAFRLLALIGLVLLSAHARAQDPNFYIFLCLGQSNMEGYPGIPDDYKGPVDPRFQVLAAVDFPELKRELGRWYPATPPLSRPPAGLSPADFFGRTLVSKLQPYIKVGVVNVAVGGCKIELFDQTTAPAYVAAAPEWMKPALAAYDGSPYRRLVEMGKLAKQAGVIKGVLLHQGESNTGEADWPAKVKTVYENLLRELDLAAAEVPLIAGEVVGADQGGKCAAMNPIIATLPATIPTAHVVSSAGCAVTDDRVHFSPAGYRELGRRYAEAMLPLLGPAAAAPAAVASAPEPLRTEFVYEAVVAIDAAVEVGATPHGRRRYIPITGGTFEGPRIRGTVLPGGADWQTSRPDGVTEVDALYSIRCDDGTVIIVRNQGVIAAGGYMRTAPRFEVPAGPHAWLNESQFVGSVAGGPRPGTVRIRVFRVL